MQKHSIPVLSVGNILGEETLGITLFRHSVKGRNEFEQPHKHDFYMVFFVEKGSGVHNVDFTQYIVNDYQVYFIRAGQVHNWSLDVDTSGFQLMLAADVITIFSNLGSFPFFEQSVPSCLSLDKKQFEEFKIHLHEIELVLSDNDVLTKEILLLRLHLMLKLLQKEYLNQFPEHDSSTKPEKIIKGFNTLIDDHFNEESSVNFYADKLNITANYLNILSQKYLKMPASDVIKQRTILEAKRLLTSTDLSIKEIGYQLGFNDNTYFSKVFKKYTGKTPGDFKKL
ncbi:HTH-type transcriptional activator RhaS [Flavobacterium bizetiae]|uniref:HTH-type transcriptional activator RhaS n=1 Tax=Flavobacterium bizetiae TaxID=2704140 RepID=A0A6J4GV13_9FLAO|nr:AraC family transcriptional regulator [Flavobacterium bizetiae]CAA9201850.1 HTH-type transcriptional activator RhaS [Flavobacterium bizetiae]CAD5344892.1 HTH-type transcriptional activator RhaS [Flavobacterium bizetiae]CAD5349955.1 HTH-type transcriptional activator RhaS [Flavobacterium bizetiae]